MGVRVNANLFSKPNYEQANASMEQLGQTILSVNPWFLIDITLRWGRPAGNGLNP
jgi:hypothetical protein